MTNQQPDIEYNNYIIRIGEHIDHNNWAYSIYKVVKNKWKRVRAIEHYTTPEAAEKAGKNYIDNFLKNK